MPLQPDRLVHAHADRQRAVDLADRLEHARVAGLRQPLAAVLLGHVEAHEPELAEVAVDLVGDPALVVDLARVDVLGRVARGSAAIELADLVGLLAARDRVREDEVLVDLAEGERLGEATRRRWRCRASAAPAQDLDVAVITVAAGARTVLAKTVSTPIRISGASGTRCPTARRSAKTGDHGHEERRSDRGPSRRDGRGHPGGEDGQGQPRHGREDRPTRGHNGPVTAEPASVEDVAEGLRAVGYLPGESTALVSYLATQLGKPILVEGPAGVGKTELAKALSRYLGAPAGAPAVLRGPRRGQGAVRVELPQAAAAHPAPRPEAPAGTTSRTTSSARSSCSSAR